jgi:hypothetical protein
VTLDTLCRILDSFAPDAIPPHEHAWWKPRPTGSFLPRRHPGGAAWRRRPVDACSALTFGPPLIYAGGPFSGRFGGEASFALPSARDTKSRWRTRTSDRASRARVQRRCEAGKRSTGRGWRRPDFCDRRRRAGRRLDANASCACPCSSRRRGVCAGVRRNRFGAGVYRFGRCAAAATPTKRFGSCRPDAMPWSSNRPRRRRPPTCSPAQLVGHHAREGRNHCSPIPPYEVRPCLNDETVLPAALGPTVLSRVSPRQRR